MGLFRDAWNVPRIHKIYKGSVLKPSVLCVIFVEAIPLFYPSWWYPNYGNICYGESHLLGPEVLKGVLMVSTPRHLEPASATSEGNAVAEGKLVRRPTI
jgi:hypothetical protein